MTTTSDLLNSDVPSRTSYIGTLAGVPGTLSYTATSGPVEALVSAFGASAVMVLVNGAALFSHNDTAQSQNFFLGTGQSITVTSSGAANATLSVRTSK